MNRRVWCGPALGAAAVLLIAAPASAHVRVDDATAPGKGGYGVVRLNVPTESATASTVGLIVTLPKDVRLTSARVLPIAGWSAKVESAAGRVSRIVWHATDAKTGGLGPAEFGVFTFTGGPWPADRSAVPLPTTQQYSDGSVVAWDQVALDASEPEHPAPIVVLGDGIPATDHHHGTVPVADVEEPAPGSDAPVLQWVLIALAVVLSAYAAGTTYLRGR